MSTTPLQFEIRSAFVNIQAEIIMSDQMKVWFLHEFEFATNLYISFLVTTQTMFKVILNPCKPI